MRFQRYRSHRIRLRGVCLFFFGSLTDWLVMSHQPSQTEKPFTMASSGSGTVSSSSCSYKMFDIAGPTTIQAAVEAAGLTYVRGHGFYRKQSFTGPQCHLTVWQFDFGSPGRSGGCPLCFTFSCGYAGDSRAWSPPPSPLPPRPPCLAFSKIQQQWLGSC